MPLVLALALFAAGGARDNELLQVVRRGDTAAVKALLAAGIPVDARFRYERTALSFAADRGYLEMVTLLLDRGADVNAKDTFYGASPVVWAAYNGHVEVVRTLLGRGASDVGGVLATGVEKRSPELVGAALASGRLSAEDLSFGLEEAQKAQATEIADVLRKAGAVPPPKADFAVDVATLANYAGRYGEKEGARDTLEFSVADGALHVSFGREPVKLVAFDLLRFRLEAAGRVHLVFKVEGGRVLGVMLKEGASERWFARLEP